MLSGKAVERAIHGHFLIDATLNAMLMSKAFHLSVIDWLEDESSSNESEPPEITSPDEETHETRQLLKMFTKMYDCITEGTLPITAVQTSPDVQKFCDIMLYSSKKFFADFQELKVMVGHVGHVRRTKKVLKGRKNW